MLVSNWKKNEQGKTGETSGWETEEGSLTQDRQTCNRCTRKVYNIEYAKHGNGQAVVLKTQVLTLRQSFHSQLTCDSAQLTLTNSHSTYDKRQPSRINMVTATTFSSMICTNTIDQASPNRGPRSGSGPRDGSVRTRDQSLINSRE